MSGMILCRSKEAKIPYYISDMGIYIYSLEELCYYIYNNIYIIGNDFISEALITFIREETREAALADRLSDLVQQHAGLAELVVTILKYVDYYNMGEIEEIRGILETLNTQNVYERLKSRADSYLGNKCYHSAIRNYQAIIEGPRDASLTGLFYAKVYHNAGVAYAKLFLYQQAAVYFEDAYKIGQHEESRKCFLAAQRLAKGDDIIERDDASEEEYVLKREIETLMDNARYSDTYRRLQEIEHLKDEGRVSEYYKEIAGVLEVWQQQYLKYTS